MALIKNNIGALLHSPKDILSDCAKRVRMIRLAQNITQKELAARAGISVGTIKRFEKCGEIQFNHLAVIALVLGHMEDFDMLFRVSEKPESLFSMKEPEKRQRARRK